VPARPATAPDGFGANVLPACVQPARRRGGRPGHERNAPDTHAGLSARANVAMANARKPYAHRYAGCILGDRSRGRTDLGAGMAANTMCRPSAPTNVATLGRHVLEGVAGGDEAAHRVTERHHRKAGVGRPGSRRHRPEIVDIVVELHRQRPLAAVAAVPAVIGAVHRIAAPVEGGNDMGVPPEVFGMAVREQDHRPRRFRHPGSRRERDAIGGANLAARFSSHAGRLPRCRRARAAAGARSRRTGRPAPSPPPPRTRPAGCRYRPARGSR